MSNTKWFNGMWESKGWNFPEIDYQWPSSKIPIINIRSGGVKKHGRRLAIGVIAVGDVAVGLVSVGAVSVGIVSFGAVALSWLASFGAVAVATYLAGGAVAISHGLSTAR